MDPRVYRQWSLPQRRSGGRAIPGLLSISKAEQLGIPGIPKDPPTKGITSPSLHQNVSTSSSPAQPSQGTGVSPAVPISRTGSSVGPTGAGGKGGDKGASQMAKLEGQMASIKRQRESAGVSGPNVMGAFGTGVALGQTATSGLGMAHQLGIVGAAVAGKVHGVMQPQDSDRDRQMRDAYQQRSEQLMIMRRQAGAQSSMGKAIPLIIVEAERIDHE